MPDESTAPSRKTVYFILASNTFVLVCLAAGLVSNHYSRPMIQQQDSLNRHREEAEVLVKQLEDLSKQAEERLATLNNQLTSIETREKDFELLAAKLSEWEASLKKRETALANSGAAPSN